MDWIAFKQRSLDNEGVYIIADDQRVIHLTENERQWNAEEMAKATASVAEPAEAPAA